MSKKIIKNFLAPYLRISCAALILLTMALFFFDYRAGIAAAVSVVILFGYFFWLLRKKEVFWKKYTQSIIDNIDEQVNQFAEANPLAACVIDKNGIILWHNDRFVGIYEEVLMLDTKLSDIIEVSYQELIDAADADRSILLNRKEKSYRLVIERARISNGSLIIYFTDVTRLEKLKTLYNNERLCFAYVDIDNYDELIGGAADQRRADVISTIEMMIMQWAAEISGTATRRYVAGRYLVLFEQKYMEHLISEKFAILDEVRTVETGRDFPASLSIGIGMGGKTIPELEANARSAIDLALGRGGDQVVVKNKNKVNFYGGTLQTVEKRNKGKSRIVAHALRQMIDHSDKVFVMGHKNPDMDSLGAALGINRIAKLREKESAIVMDTAGVAVESLYKRAVESDEHRIIGSEEALQSITKESLLVVVDTHRPVLTECPELLKRTNRIVLIDHHRKAVDSIDNAVLTYMESYASSTSELVTEILQYIEGGKKTIDKLEAEALLAGIAVDTKNFSDKAGVRTFEAAAWLRKNGADTMNVRHYFKTDMESFITKATIIAGAEILPGGFALSLCRERHHDIQLVLAQASDELLNIRGVRASFVLGERKKGSTAISARSLGEVNVQAMMEKLGGGGHLTTAAAQLDKPLDEAVDALKEVIMQSNRGGN